MWKKVQECKVKFTKYEQMILLEGLVKNLDNLRKEIIPWKEGIPGCHGRFSLRGNSDGYIGKVVNGSISHNDTLGCLSPAVDSSQPTCNFLSKYIKSQAYFQAQGSACARKDLTPLDIRTNETE